MDRERMQKMAEDIATALLLTDLAPDDEDEWTLRINACATVLASLHSALATRCLEQPKPDTMRKMIHAINDVAERTFYLSESHGDKPEEVCMHRLSGAMSECLKDACKIDPAKLDRVLNDACEQLTAPYVQANVVGSTAAECRNAVDLTKRFYQAGVELLKGASAEAKRKKKEKDHHTN